MPGELYLDDRECLACNVKGDGVAKIFTATNATSADGNHIATACESCHGPAREHIGFTVQHIACPPLGSELEQVACQAIRELKPANTCIQWHIRHSHKEHVNTKGSTRNKGKSS